MQLSVRIYTYRCVGNKQLCLFRCKLCVTELSAWKNILQDYTTRIFFGKRLKYSLHKILCRCSLNDIKFSKARHGEGMWLKDGYTADEDICTEAEEVRAL
jgi:hypothetical protein